MYLFEPYMIIKVCMPNEIFLFFWWVGGRGGGGGRRRWVHSNYLLLPNITQNLFR